MSTRGPPRCVSLPPVDFTRGSLNCARSPTKVGQCLSESLAVWVLGYGRSVHYRSSLIHRRTMAAASPAVEGSTGVTPSIRRY